MTRSTGPHPASAVTLQVDGTGRPLDPNSVKLLEAHAMAGDRARGERDEPRGTLDVAVRRPACVRLTRLSAVTEVDGSAQEPVKRMQRKARSHGLPHIASAAQPLTVLRRDQRPRWVISNLNFLRWHH